MANKRKKQNKLVSLVLTYSKPAGTISVTTNFVALTFALFVILIVNVTLFITLIVSTLAVLLIVKLTITTSNKREALLFV